MIYRIQPITSSYLCLHIDGKEARKALGEDTDFNLDPSPISYLETWQRIKVDFYDDDAGAAIIPDIAIRVGKLFLSQRAYSALRDLLRRHGEFLPVTYKEGEGYIFNCLEVAETHDAVVQEQSMHDSLNDRFAIVFDEEKLAGINLFKCKVDFDGLFCSEAVKAIVEREGLTGIEFSIDVGHPFPPDTEMLKRH